MRGEGYFLRILQLSVQLHKRVGIGVLCKVQKFTTHHQCILEGGRWVLLGPLTLVWGKLGGLWGLQNKFSLGYSVVFFGIRRCNLWGILQ